MIDIIINPKKDTYKIGRREFEYTIVHGSIEGIVFGHIKIERCLTPLGWANDSLYFKRKQPLPCVAWQSTHPAFRGRGLSGQLIVKANEALRSQYGFPLYSDVAFWDNEDPRYKEKPGKRVWEKLVDANLAVYAPFNAPGCVISDRWHLRP